jgi:hypothetical protein
MSGESMVKTAKNGRTSRSRSARQRVRASDFVPRPTGVHRWLRASGYADVARLIDTVMRRWRMSRVATRRNWWAILAGGKHGEPCVIGGRVFPVLAAAQRRQGKTVTPNALERRPGEEAPGVSPTNRWAKRARAQGGE